ncbi:MAG: hypothetical protein MR902_04500 [Campylobacter sp.]|nr:hypothetical protein [Campylobacter sp.]
MVCFLSGCASKERVVYQDVYVPIKCPAKMPEKPKNKRSFESHKALMVYFLECESLLKECIGDKK